MRAGGLLIAAVALLAGCESSPAGGQLAVVFFENGTQLVSTSEGHFALGPVLTGTSVDQQITFKNVGRSTLTVTSIERVSGPAVAFDSSVDATAPYQVNGFPSGAVLEPSEVTDFDLVFAAPATLEASVSENVVLWVHAQSGSGDQTVMLFVDASSLGAPCIVDSSIDFGTLRVGETSTLPLLLENPTNVEVTAFVSSLGGDVAFSDLPEATFTLEPMQAFTRGYTFSPTHAGLFSASLVVKPAASCEPTAVTLWGMAVDSWLVLTPQPLVFPSTLPGRTSHASLEFQNFSWAVLNVSHLSVTGDFLVTTDSLAVPPATVAGDGSRTAGRASLDLTFTPTALGPRVGSLSFDTDAAAQPGGVAALEGFGGAPAVVVTPSSTDFGQIGYFPNGTQMFGASAVTIANHGVAPLHFGDPAWEFTGAGAAQLCAGDFDLDAGCLGRLAANDPENGIASGASVRLPVHLVPSSAAGPSAWQLLVHTDDPDQPVSVVQLTADEEQLPPCTYSVDPPALDFGEVRFPATRDLVVTIANPGSSSVVCSIEGVDLSFASGSGFSLPQGPIVSAVLQPGQTLSVPVRFTPIPLHDSADQSGALTFAISSSSAPRVSVPLAASE